MLPLPSMIWITRLVIDPIFFNQIPPLIITTLEWAEIYYFPLWCNMSLLLNNVMLPQELLATTDRFDWTTKKPATYFTIEPFCRAINTSAATSQRDFGAIFRRRSTPQKKSRVHRRWIRPPKERCCVSSAVSAAVIYFFLNMAEANPAFRQKWSKVWKHFTLHSTRACVVCNLCKSNLAWHGSTTSMIQHLKRKHFGAVIGEGEQGG